MKPEATEQPEAIRKEVRLEYVLPDDVVAPVADHLHVSHAKGVFVISFLELREPMLLGTPEEKQMQMEEVKSVRAVCVSRVCVPADKMASFVQAMRENFEKYQKARAGEAEQ